MPFSVLYSRLDIQYNIQYTIKDYYFYNTVLLSKYLVNLKNKVTPLSMVSHKLDLFLEENSISLHLSLPWLTMLSTDTNSNFGNLILSGGYTYFSAGDVRLLLTCELSIPTGKGQNLILPEQNTTSGGLDLSVIQSLILPLANCCNLNIQASVLIPGKSFQEKLYDNNNEYLLGNTYSLLISARYHPNAKYSSYYYQPSLQYSYKDFMVLRNNSVSIYNSNMHTILWLMDASIPLGNQWYLQSGIEIKQYFMVGKTYSSQSIRTGIGFFWE